MYDKEGIVDNYITFLLHSLKPYLKTLIVVCNGNLKEKEIIKLKCITEKIIIRENKGYDVAAWKSVLCKLIEEKNIDEYDEVLLCNDSFYGPLNDWKEMFRVMDEEVVDFWGITRHPQSYETVRGYIPEHLQSFFVVIRKSMVSSVDFYQYWKSMRLEGNNLLDAIEEHELRFTSYFEEKGYKWKAYIDSSDLENDANERLNYNAYYFSPLELIRDYCCPIVKKKALVDKNLCMVAGEEVNLTLEYIQQKTNYDSSMIIENLIRIMPKEKLYTAFQMQYIACDEEPHKKRTIERGCLFVLGECGGKLEKYLKEYNFSYIDLFTIENSEDMDLYLNQKKYSIIGLLDFSSVKTITAIESLRRKEDLIENMIGTYKMVSYLFEKNKDLGILYPNIRSIRMEAVKDNFYQRSFWCRRNYFEEKEKFLYGTICTEHYAREQLSSLDYQFFNLYNIKELPDVFNQKTILDNDNFKEYLRNKEQFYVYGTGVYGRKIYDILKYCNKTLIAFVVSDGQPTGKIYGKDVLTLSGFCSKRVKDSGLIVALSKKVQLEVKDNLRNSGITDVIYI